MPHSRSRIPDHANLSTGSGTPKPSDDATGHALRKGRRKRVDNDQEAGNAKLRVLHFKASRPLFLSVLGVLHLVTIGSSLSCGASQILDLLAILRNRNRLGRAPIFVAEWELVQSVSLRLYGLAFAVVVVATELSE